jgi:hypothetical protein
MEDFMRYCKNNKIIHVALGVICALILNANAIVHAQSATAGVAYEHSFARSGFDIGVNARSRSLPGSEIVEGTDGAFYINAHTRAALATRSAPNISRANAAQVQLPTPFSSKAKVNEDAVKSYLTAAGVPVSEVSATHVTTTMITGGPVSGAWDPKDTRLLYYTAHLERALGGVPVQGSFAFAALDGMDQVITEGVYWPAIPASVVAAAQNFSQQLGNATNRASFIAKVRRARAEAADVAGQVKIVHTSANSDAPFSAIAAYVVVHKTAQGARSVTDMFDENGTPVTIVDSVAPASPDSQKIR